MAPTSFTFMLYYIHIPNIRVAKKFILKVLGIKLGKT